jgi:hypothetical protein
MSFEDIGRAGVDTVRSSIVVRVRVGDMASANTGKYLGRIKLACILAIRFTIAIDIRKCSRATANSSRNIRGSRAIVIAICNAIAVTICIGNTASTNSWQRFERIGRTLVYTIINEVAISVDIRYATTARCPKTLQDACGVEAVVVACKCGTHSHIA